MSKITSYFTAPNGMKEPQTRERAVADGPAEDTQGSVRRELSQGQDEHVAKRARVSTEDDAYMSHPTHPLSGALAPLTVYGPRDGLILYMKHADTNPEGLVVYFDDDWVFIQDKFPKGRVHFLLMSRNPNHFRKHPMVALKDVEFLASVRKEVEKAVKIASSELERKYGQSSAKDKARRDAMEGDEIPDELPEGRDWTKDIQVGVHAWPSMSHLHIHILSRDLSGPYMKSMHHYNTFSTPFFVKLDEFPLADDDPRWHIEERHFQARDGVCWRCGRDFKRSFKALRIHLESEFKEWCKE